MIKNITLFTYLAMLLSSKIYGNGEIYTNFEANPLWQKVAVESGYRQGNLVEIKKQVAQRVRDSRHAPLSFDAYKMLHALTPRGAAKGMNLPESQNTGVNVLLLENSGIRRSDIRVNPDSETQPCEMYTQNPAHGSSTASLILQVSPNADVILQHASSFSIDKWTNSKVINMSFGSNFYPTLLLKFQTMYPRFCRQFI